MVWIRLDENLPDEPEFVEAGPLALALHVAALGYNNRHSVDFFITRRVAHRKLIDFDVEVAPGQTVQVDPTFVIGKLLAARCSQCGASMRWIEVEGGYRIHDHHQPTRAEVLEQQKKKADAGRRGGQARAQNRAQANGKQASSTRQAGASGVLEDGDEANGKPDPTRPPVPSKADAFDGSRGDRGGPPPLVVIDGTAAVPDLPPAAPEVEPEPVTAQTLLAEHVRACHRRPPERVRGQLARETKALLDEGYEPDAVRAGLAIVRDRGLHPSTLPSAVNEALNPPRPRASPGMDRRREQLYTNAAAARAWAERRMQQEQQDDQAGPDRLGAGLQPHQRALARPAGPA